MKTIEKYECEICGKQYRDPVDAQACEDRGLPDLSKMPVGCIDGDCSDTLYGKMVFAIAKVGIGDLDPHRLCIFCWACRDNGCADNTGDQWCMGNNLFQKGYPANIDWDVPCVQRMIKALEDKGIEPTVWDGEKAVPIPHQRRRRMRGWSTVGQS